MKKVCTAKLLLLGVAIFSVGNCQSASYRRIDQNQVAQHLTHVGVMPVRMEPSIFSDLDQLRQGKEDGRFTADYKSQVSAQVRARAGNFDATLVEALQRRGSKVSILAAPAEKAINRPKFRDPMAIYPQITPEALQSIFKNAPDLTAVAFAFVSAQRFYAYEPIGKGGITYFRAALCYHLTVYDRSGNVIHGGVKEIDDPYTGRAFDTGFHAVMFLEQQELVSSWSGTYKPVAISVDKLAWTDLDAAGLKGQLLGRQGLVRELAE